MNSSSTDALLLGVAMVSAFFVVYLTLVPIINNLELTNETKVYLPLLVATSSSLFIGILTLNLVFLKPNQHNNHQDSVK